MVMHVDQRINPELADVVQRLVSHFQPDRIYLFGSQARGDATEDSDYDLLIVVPDTDRTSYELATEAYGMLWNTGIIVEVLFYPRERFDRHSRVIASLASTVLREGRLLYDGQRRHSTAG